MKNIEVIKKKINTLSKMLRAYNALKLLSGVKLKQYSTKQREIINYIYELGTIQLYKHYRKSSQILLVVFCPRKIMGGDFFKAMQNNLLRIIKYINNSENVSLCFVGENRQVAMSFASSVLLLGNNFKEKVFLDIELCKEKIINHSKDTIIFCTATNDEIKNIRVNENIYSHINNIEKFNLFNDIDIVDEYFYFEDGNYKDSLNVLLLVSYFYYMMYTSMIDENKNRLQITEGAVKNIKDMIIELQRKMHSTRQNKITNDLAGIISSRRTLL